METSKRRSRFVDFAPSGKTFRVTAYDLDLLDLLQDYRYLPSTFIIALAGGNPIYLRQRLTALRKDFGLVKCPSPSWAAANALQRPAVYQLTDKGELLLKAQGRWRDLKKTGEPFKDQLTVCMARASIAIGLKAYPQLSLSSPGDILKHAPEQTRNLQSPFIIPVEFTYRSNTTETFLKTTVRHDCLPFGIQNADTTRWLLSPGMEIDCDTEGLTSTNAHRASIDKHLLEILELLKGG